MAGSYVWVVGNGKMCFESFRTHVGRLRAVNGVRRVAPESLAGMLGEAEAEDIYLLSSCNSSDTLDLWLGAILEAKPSAKVIVCGDAGRLRPQKLLMAGAAGCVLTCDPHDIVEAVRTVMQGRMCFAPETLRDDLEHRRREAESKLTPTEWETCRLAAEGLSDREIAEVRHVSESTVGTELQAAFKRLGVHSRKTLMGLIC